MAKNDEDSWGGPPRKNRVECLLEGIQTLLATTERQNAKRHAELIATLKHRERAFFTFEVGVPQLKERQAMPLELRITNEQKVTVTLHPVTDSGKPAKLDGSPAWTVISGNSQVVVAEDGMSADLVSADDPGDTIVSVKADADLGDGVEEVADTITLTVIGATAKNLGLTASAPVPK